MVSAHKCEIDTRFDGRKVDATEQYQSITSTRPCLTTSSRDAFDLATTNCDVLCLVTMYC